MPNPPPPPPPPPAPPANLILNTSIPKSNKDLLLSIQKGAKLKKVPESAKQDRSSGIISAGIAGPKTAVLTQNQGSTNVSRLSINSTSNDFQSELKKQLLLMKTGNKDIQRRESVLSKTNTSNRRMSNGHVNQASVTTSKDNHAVRRFSTTVIKTPSLVMSNKPSNATKQEKSPIVDRTTHVNFTYDRPHVCKDSRSNSLVSNNPLVISSKVDPPKSSSKAISISSTNPRPHHVTSSRTPSSSSVSPSEIKTPSSKPHRIISIRAPSPTRLHSSNTDSRSSKPIQICSPNLPQTTNNNHSASRITNSDLPPFQFQSANINQRIYETINTNKNRLSTTNQSPLNINRGPPPPPPTDNKALLRTSVSMNCLSHTNVAQGHNGRQLPSPSESHSQYKENISQQSPVISDKSRSPIEPPPPLPSPYKHQVNWADPIAPPVPARGYPPPYVNHYSLTTSKSVPSFQKVLDRTPLPPNPPSYEVQSLEIRFFSVFDSLFLFPDESLFPRI